VLLRELGVDPADVAAEVGLDLDVFRNPENSIPFTAAAKLLQVGAMRTGCAHFGLLLGQRSDTRSLGLVGNLMRNAPTLGRALQDLVENLHRYVRGGVWYLAVRNGVALIGYAIHQRGTEGVDHFYDGTMAFAFNGIRELCGAVPDEVLLARKPPPDVHPYHRLFQVPVRFDAEQTALVFPPANWNVLCPAPIPASARSWKNRSRNTGRSLCPALPTKWSGSFAPASYSATLTWRRWRTV